MSRLKKDRRRLRRSFGKIEGVVSLPNLIEIQSKSFNNFIQLDFLPSERKNSGLEKIFRDIFPIEHSDLLSLEYVSYELGNWACICGQLKGLENRYKWSCSSCQKSGCSRLKDSVVCSHCKKQSARYITCKKCSSRVFITTALGVDACRYSGKTFSMPLKVKMQLVSWEPSGESGKKGAQAVAGKQIRTTVRDIKEQQVFFCDLPVMSDLYEDESGTFCLGSKSCLCTRLV